MIYQYMIVDMLIYYVYSLISWFVNLLNCSSVKLIVFSFIYSAYIFIIWSTYTLICPCYYVYLKLINELLNCISISICNINLNSCINLMYLKNVFNIIIIIYVEPIYNASICWSITLFILWSVDQYIYIHCSGDLLICWFNDSTLNW